MNQKMLEDRLIIQLVRVTPKGTMTAGDKKIKRREITAASCSHKKKVISPLTKRAKQ
jgi:hypothetical protein